LQPTDISSLREAAVASAMCQARNPAASLHWSPSSVPVPAGEPQPYGPPRAAQRDRLGSASFE
jgi:hypothetical protein